MLMLLIGYEFIKAVRYAAMNRVLQKKVYIDGATGLPNRNKCDELLSQPDAAPEDIGVCSFDLNNLRIINNSMGHEAGDEYIRRFAVCLRASMPAEQFVGRAGGDEFIALLNDVTQQDVEDIILQVQNEARCYNEFSKQIFIDFAFGYALSTHSRETNLKLLLNQADKNMYECKARMKAKKKI